MSRKLKSYLDEDFLKAKRVKTRYEKKLSDYFNSPQSFKDKIWKNYLTSKNFSDNFSVKERIHLTKLLTAKRGYNPQVLIKITGADKNFNQLKNHIKYISRNGELEIFCQDDYGDEIVFKGADSISEVAETFQDDTHKIPTKSEIERQNLKEQNENIHMVFSMKGENNIPSTDIKKAAIKTIKEKFPNTHFILAIHNDTDNPHCHLDLKAFDKNAKRIKITPTKLNELRNEFAKNLVELGHKAVNHSYKRNDKFNERFADTWDGHKAHHFRVTGYGEDRYNFSNDEKTEMSYYVKFETAKGKQTYLWGKHLKDLVQKHQITTNDYVRFAVTSQEAVKKRIYDKKTKQWFEKIVHKNIWDCSIEGKREIELTPLKESEKKKSEFRAIVSARGLETSQALPPKTKQQQTAPIIKNQATTEKTTQNRIMYEPKTKPKGKDVGR